MIQYKLLPEQVKFGKKFLAREALPPDTMFGFYDHSKCFFPDELERATKYVKVLTEHLEEDKRIGFDQDTLQLTG